MNAQTGPGVEFTGQSLNPLFPTAESVVFTRTPVNNITISLAMHPGISTSVTRKLHTYTIDPKALISLWPTQ